MATMAPAPPTNKWLVWWTALNVVFVALPLLSMSVADRSVRVLLFMTGFMASILVGAVVAHRRGPFVRYLPLLIPALVVGAWPLYRFLQYQEKKPGNIFLSLEAFVWGVVAVWTALDALKARGWISDSPWRRRLSGVWVLAMVVNNLLGFNNPFLTWGIIVAAFATMFWPSRRRVVHS